MAFDVSATALVADRVPYRLRGRGVGVLNSCMFLGAGAGALLAGELHRSLPFTQVFGLGTLLALAGALVAAYATRSTVTPRD
jgi:MFS family permease